MSRPDHHAYFFTIWHSGREGVIESKPMNIYIVGDWTGPVVGILLENKIDMEEITNDDKRSKMLKCHILRNAWQW